MSQRPLYLDFWNPILLCYAVGQYCFLVMEKIQDPIVAPIMRYTQLINCIPQKIRLWPAQLMTALFEPLEPDHNFILHLLLKAIEPY